LGAIAIPPQNVYGYLLQNVDKYYGNLTLPQNYPSLVGVEPKLRVVDLIVGTRLSDRIKSEQAQWVSLNFAQISSPPFVSPLSSSGA